MEYAIGEEFYSEENDSWYRVVRGRHNSCKGCIFAEWDDNNECECYKPSDAGECLADIGMMVKRQSLKMHKF